MAISVKIEWESDVHDAEWAKQLEKAGCIVWTLCESGGVRYVVPRISISDVLGYVTVPEEIEV